MSWSNWRGAEAKKKAHKVAREALRDLGLEVMAGAKEEVPFRDSDLQTSGTVRRSRAKTPRVLLSFGGRKVPYAVRWHEQDPKRGFRGGRKRRYLADPFNRIVPTRLNAIVAAHWRRRFGI